jgi:hypothetical protein
MTTGYVVYVDESGDEGFLFDKGSSEWFVLSAAILPKLTDLTTVKLIDRVRKLLGRKKRDILHFRSMKHEHRLPLINEIQKADLRAITILIHKPSIQNVETFQQKYRLYYYATRLLLERVSWYCRDHRGHPHTQTARINFSTRTSMKYEDLRDYIKYLKTNTGPLGVQIDWSVINSRQITAHSVEKMGSQIADAIASGFFFGLEKRYNFTEDRYARILKSVIYNHKGRFDGYGIKIWPSEAKAKLGEEQYDWLRTTYQFED